MGLSADRGVVISAVNPAGPAAKAGLQPGDVIVKDQGQAVANTAQFAAGLAKHDLAGGVRLHVQRGEHQRFVFLKSAE